METTAPGVARTTASPAATGGAAARLWDRLRAGRYPGLALLAGLAALGLTAIGAYLRLDLYLARRSMWTDEAMIGLVIIGQQMYREPYLSVPGGWMALQRFVTAILGHSEFAFRATAVAAGIASLPLTYWLGRRHLGAWVGLVATAILSLAGPTLYYAGEAKPYAIDLLVAVLLSSAFIGLERSPLKWWHLGLLVVGAMLTVWVSFPALLMLAGLLSTAFLLGLKDRQWRQAAAAAVIGVATLASFGLTFVDRVRSLSNSEYLNSYWQTSFAPLPTSGERLAWYFNWLRVDAWYPVGLHTGTAWVALALPGIVWLVWRRPRMALYLLSPVAFMLVASMLHRYPIGGRLVLFLGPTEALLLAAGVVGVAELVYRWAGPLRHLAVPVGAVLAAGVLVAGVPEARRVIDKPYPHPEDRPVFDFIRTHWQPGDRVYSYGGWAIAQRYYASLYGIPADAQLGPDFLGSTLQADANRGLRDVPDLRSDRRVWVVSLDSDRKRVVQILDGLGTRLGKYNALDTGVVLYGFNACTSDCLVPINDGDPD